MKSLKIMMMTLMMCFVTIVSFGQVEYATYSEGTIAVVTKVCKSQKNVYIDVSKDAGIILTQKTMHKYVDFILECYLKASEWDSIAKANNILDMPSKYYGKFGVSGYFDYGGWHFGTTQMKLLFNITDGVTVSYIYMYKMTASDNQFMKSDSVMFRLTDKLLEEIQTLLTDEAIDKFVVSKNETESLFNE